MIESLALDQLLGSTKEVRRGHDKASRRRSMHHLQIAAEVKGWSELFDGVQTHFVVEVLWIAPFDDIHRGLRHCCFHFEYGSSILLCLRRRYSRKLEHAGDVADVLGSDLDGLRVIVQIELSPRKRHAALIELRDYMGSIVKIGLRAKAKQGRIRIGIRGIPGAGNRTMEIGHHLRDFALVAHRLDALQLKPQGGQGSSISLFLIRASRPV